MTYPPKLGGFKLVMTYSPVTFLKQVIDELKKVTWPTREETIRLTVSVIVITLIVSFFLFSVDFVLTKALDLLLSR